MKQKVTTYLWCDGNAEEMMNFYVSVFNGSPVQQPESKIISITHWSEGPLEGKVMSSVFELAGQQLAAFDGGSAGFKFNEAVSLLIDCESQEEIDYYWDKLTFVPESEACGWVKDKFGMSWQIIPTVMVEMLTDPDREKAGRAMQAMLKMKKIDIAELQGAFEGK